MPLVSEGSLLVHPYPNSGPHGFTAQPNTSISPHGGLWEIHRTHRPHAEHGRSAYSGDIFQAQVLSCGSSISRAFLRGVKPCQEFSRPPALGSPKSLVILTHLQIIHAALFPHYWLTRIFSFALEFHTLYLHFPPALHLDGQMTKF